jgi:hypothetical protein
MSSFYPSNIILKVDDFFDEKDFVKCERFLNLVVALNIKCLLGIIGRTLKDTPPHLLDIVKGHPDNFELYNHSMNHIQGKADVQEAQEEIRKYFGYAPDIYGAPCNNISPEIFAELQKWGIKKCFGIWEHECFDKIPRKYPINGYRELENEVPGSMIQWSNFIAKYDKEHVGLKIYQVHPIMWSDSDFELFERAIRLMLADGKHFVGTEQPKHEATNYTLDDITFIVHAFKRPDALLRLKQSITEFYPKNTLIIYDDSDYDKGLSWGRNHLVAQVQTPLYLLLDDDFVFTAQTKIEKLLEKLNTGYDIVAGAIWMNNICHYEGRYTVKRTELEYATAWEEPYDFVFNFFLAKQEVSGWDEQLKLAEHTAFFLAHQNTWKIGYEPQCVIEHHQMRDENYTTYRIRAKGFFLSFLKRFGFTRVHGIGGETLVNK